METVDLESGERKSTGGGDVCFSDEDDEGSCISQVFSMDDGTEDNGRKLSSVDCSIIIDDILQDVVVVVVDDDDDDDDDDEKLCETTNECRICQLTMEFEIAIELGCSCKDDLGAAHKHCAETWFNIKGNRICEICNSVALNVLVSNENEAIETSASPSDILTGLGDHRSCSNGHRVVNFILSCMIFAFSISWLFHLNVDP